MARMSAGTLLSYLRRGSPAGAGPDDGLLLARFAQGDDHAFTELVRRHARLVAVASGCRRNHHRAGLSRRDGAAAREARRGGPVR